MEVGYLLFVPVIILVSEFIVMELVLTGVGELFGKLAALAMSFIPMR